MGFKAGIWLAPLFAHSNSQTLRDHPDWFVKDLQGNFVDGTKFSSLSTFIRPKRYVLNYQNPEVTEYHNRIVDYLKDCGFQLLKADFLHAYHRCPKAYLKSDPDHLLHQILTVYSQNFYTIASNCPPSAAAGVVHARRISSDINIPHIKYLWPANHLI